MWIDVKREKEREKKREKLMDNLIKLKYKTDKKWYLKMVFY